MKAIIVVGVISFVVSSAWAERQFVPDFGEIEVMTDEVDAFRYAHELQVNRFIYSPGSGFERMLVIEHHRVGQYPPVASWNSPKEKVTLTAMKLVGLLVAEEPRVYEKPAEKKEILGLEYTTKAEVRALDIFETIALAKLADGAAMVTWQGPGKVRGFGAIRAMQSCTECHTKANEGDLLGAFTYTGDTISLEPEAAAELQQKRTAVGNLLVAGEKTEAFKNVFGKGFRIEGSYSVFFSDVLYPELPYKFALAELSIITPGMWEDVHFTRKRLPAWSESPLSPSAKGLQYRGGYRKSTSGP